MPTDLDLHCLQRQGISGFSRTRVKIFFLFSEKISFDTTCTLSPKETIRINCQSLFSGKIKKNINLSSAELAQRVVKVMLAANLDPDQTAKLRNHKVDFSLLLINQCSNAYSCSNKTIQQINHVLSSSKIQNHRDSNDTRHYIVSYMPTVLTKVLKEFAQNGICKLHSSLMFLTYTCMHAVTLAV